MTFNTGSLQDAEPPATPGNPRDKPAVWQALEQRGRNSAELDEKWATPEQSSAAGSRHPGRCRLPYKAIGPQTKSGTIALMNGSIPASVLFELNRTRRERARGMSDLARYIIIC